MLSDYLNNEIEIQITDRASGSSWVKGTLIDITDDIITLKDVNLSYDFRYEKANTYPTEIFRKEMKIQREYVVSMCLVNEK